MRGYQGAYLNMSCSSKSKEMKQEEKVESTSNLSRCPFVSAPLCPNLVARADRDSEKLDKWIPPCSACISSGGSFSQSEFPTSASPPPNVTSGWWRGKKRRLQKEKSKQHLQTKFVFPFCFSPLFPVHDVEFITQIKEWQILYVCVCVRVWMKDQNTAFKCHFDCEVATSPLLSSQRGSREIA